MIDINEAKARIALAEMEERQAEKRSARNAARWRLASTLFWMVAVASAGLYVIRTKPEFSASELVVFACVVLMALAWRHHCLCEELNELRSELTRLKNEAPDKKT